MRYSIETWCEFLLHSWQEASMAQYGLLVAAIVVIGWLISRYTST